MAINDPDDTPQSTTCPFSVIIDTREQAPWHFSGISSGGKTLIVPLITGESLPTGDYSVRGCESRLLIERKSLSDAYGSIGSGRERFEREMERMAAMISGANLLGENAAAHVVVESAWDHEPPTSTRVSVEAMRGTVAAWSQRYGVHWWFPGSRREAELWAFRLMSQWWKDEQAQSRGMK